MIELIALGIVTTEGIHEKWNERLPSEALIHQLGKVYQPNGGWSALETCVGSR
jgi:hypothetical protein